ncbi:SPOR domain-containing protein [Planctomonas psychrotolerans]|uniref:SPOR domain-containing protein n=1 Tax=Planctomonas psychrotolerans TaxID=2528712 RepID=UPI00123C708E|nr:SPOR domain-containing protein [Planctomonas psychrotolerans]
MAHEADTQFWFNSRTGEVEQGAISPAPDRIGPFETRREAEHAWDRVRENSARWAAEDAAENR